jgi:ubiquinone/menaquinone biosynthesis C-methylase UbiE
MERSEEPTKQENTYFLDAESNTETTRLLHMDRLVTRAMGGVLSEQEPFLVGTLHDVLDIACGPGGWVLDMAYTAPQAKITGVDISHTTIQYARALAYAQRLENATFQEMNAQAPLEFADQSFDLVNARFVAGFMSRDSWPALLQECKRVLRPGGILRLTETDWSLGNCPTYVTLSSKATRALWQVGHSFAPEGTLGVTATLGPFLRKAGLQDVHMQAHVLDFSAGTEAWEPMCENLKIGMQLAQPFLLKMGAATEEELQQLYRGSEIEMLSDDFCAVWYLLTAWGMKR